MKRQNLNNATLAIVGGSIVTPFKTIENGAVIISEKTILYVGENKRLKIPKTTKIVNARNGIISPGFIDLHVNGGGGKDITAGTEDAVYGIARGHAVCGTTGLLVAVTGPSMEIARKGFAAAYKLGQLPTGGAKILGVHMEGPFINPKRQGPIFRMYDKVTQPSIDVMKELIDASNGSLKIVTMAPEFENSLKVMEYLVENGIRVSIGHTEATYEQAVDAIRAGASYSAHIFNAMTALHHRQPGVVGALLSSSDNLTVELVADGHHVHPAVIDIIIKSKGLQNIVLASDATEIVGTNLDHFILPIGEKGLRVDVRNGRTWGPKGQIIGSILQMNHAVKYMVNWFNLPLNDVIASATYLPAKAIGAENTTGSLEPGKAADIVVMNKNFDVLYTIVDGQIVSQGELLNV
jgi:N-acetylglucosamine-6-phosphate deacetylase